MTLTDLRGYSLSISKATGYTDQSVLDIIEDTMRGERRTLDNISKARFNRLARDSTAVAIALGAVAACDYAIALVEV